MDGNVRAASGAVQPAGGRVLRVFVTGGTGLVGSHVAEQLRARGDDVVALVRSGSDATFLSSIGCELVRGDLERPDTPLAASMRGCDGLVHAAALVAARADWPTYERLNVTATRDVLTAASQAGVQRAVHVSSVAVYGGLVDAPITEERWLERPVPEPAFYARSKRLAEQEAIAVAERQRLEVTCVRPCVVYGERDRHMAPRLDRLCRLPALPLPDGGRRSAPLVYAGNVARGVLRCLDLPGAAGRAFNLANDGGLTPRQLVRWWCEAIDRRTPRLVPIPGAAVEKLARGVDAVVARLPFTGLPHLSRPARLLRGPNPYDSTRAQQTLDWNELVPPADAVARTALHFASDTP